MSSSDEIEKGPFDEKTSFGKLALEVESRQFWVPRAILAAYSPVFEKMLYGEFVESKKDSITLPGKKSADIEELLKCLIPHPFVKEIDLSNADVILGFAEEYQIEDLRRRAEKVLNALVEKLENGDEKLLQITVICSKYRLKELLRVSVKRCGLEFNQEKLETIFGDLRDKVMACIMLYKLSMSPDQKCKYSRDPYCRAACERCRNNKTMKCMFCGVNFCGNCLNLGCLTVANCTGNVTLANVENSVNALMDRL